VSANVAPTFNSFPVAAGLRSCRRSQPARARFQFFPSCCRKHGHTRGQNRAQVPLRFQFFPSCCSTVVYQITLSPSMFRNSSFNSFPVAAVFEPKAVIVAGPVQYYFQFFPSCCSRPSRPSRRRSRSSHFQFFPSCCLEDVIGKVIRAWRRLSILSQLLLVEGDGEALFPPDLSILSQLLPTAPLL